MSQDIPPVIISLPQGYKPKPSTNTAKDVSLWNFGLAILVLWLIMKYVPNGLNIGLIILAGVFISTPDAVQGVANFLDFIQGTTLYYKPGK
jgi:hypothetical protein